MEGTVKNITSYGVFIDLGGVDGLIHITDLSWGRVNHPEEIVELELMRLDKLQLLEWRKAQKGDGKAVQNILKIMERRASYLGLDKKPTETNVEQHNTAIFIGGTEEEYIQALQNARAAATGKVIDA